MKKRPPPTTIHKTSFTKCSQ